jgi:nickel-dependent lactate racemase
MGEVPGYGPISFNSIVVSADVKIIVGSILFHMFTVALVEGPRILCPASATSIP